VQAPRKNRNNRPVEYRFLSYNDEGFLDWEITQYWQEGITTQEQGTTKNQILQRFNINLLMIVFFVVIA